VTICAWYRNCATCNHEIGDSRHEGYMNKQHRVFTIRHVINTKTFYENLYKCVCVCVWVGVCVRARDIGIVEQYKACWPCHFHYRQLYYFCYFIFISELDMSVLSTSFKLGRLASIPLMSMIVQCYTNNSHISQLDNTHSRISIYYNFNTLKL